MPKPHKSPESSDLDTPIYGAEAIARVLNFLDDKGRPNKRKAYYVVARGYVDADKMGRILVSTKRRLLRPHLEIA